MTGTNGPLDAPFPSWHTCPYCGGGDGRLMIHMRNLRRIVAHFFAQLPYFGADVGDRPRPLRGFPFPLLRRCRQCDRRFWAKPHPHAVPICDNCGYDLTGNVSGACPECGWELPEEVRGRVAFEDREEATRKDLKTGKTSSPDR